VTLDLFERVSVEPQKEKIAPGAFMLRGFALPYEPAIVDGLNQVTAKAPFRHMVTPGGFRMSVAMTNCGRLGWVTDRSGYRYDAVDSVSGKKWPAMPEPFLTLARNAAAEAGFDEFAPDACLVNRYQPGAGSPCIRTRTRRTIPLPLFPCPLESRRYFNLAG